jgi:hypothetical protein
MRATSSVGKKWEWLTVFTLIAAGAAPAAGQRYASGLREVREMGTAGINLAIGAPTGDFAQNVDAAGGFDAFAAVNLGAGSPMALRFEGAYLVYGSDHQFDLNTTYSIATFGFGPQVTLGEGPMRLYGFGTVGLSYISAYSSFRDGCGCYSYSQTDFSDWTSALQVGGGVLLTLGRRSSVSLDLGVRSLYSGFANYVAPGDVQPQPNGDVIVYTSRARPNLTMVHLGVSVGLR